MFQSVHNEKGQSLGMKAAGVQKKRRGAVHDKSHSNGTHIDGVKLNGVR